MNQHLENKFLALEELAPEVFAEWKRRAGATAEGRAWTEYTLLLNSYAEAIRRAPFTAQACEEINIIEHMHSEFACLTDLLLLLFPDGEVREKSYTQGGQTPDEV